MVVDLVVVVVVWCLAVAEVGVVVVAMGGKVGREETLAVAAAEAALVE